MRGSLMAAAAAVAVLGVAGCDRGGDADTAAAPAAPPETAAPAADPPLAPAGTAAGFVSRLAISDMYEIQSSAIALQRSQNNDVKRFAQMIIDDHTRTSNESRAVIAQQGVQATLPAQMDEPRRNLINQLNSATAEDFDDRYIDQQTEAHQNVLALIRDYAENGDNEALREWARRTAPAIENHLQMARGLKRTPGGEAAGGAANDNAGAERR